MNMLDRTADRLARARTEVGRLEAELAELRLASLRTVGVAKRGDTLTLTLGDRVFKVKRHSRWRDRWNITRNGLRVATEFMGSIHDVRFALARGYLK